MKKLIALAVICLMLSNCTSLAASVGVAGNVNASPTPTQGETPTPTPTATNTATPTQALALVPDFDHIVLIALENQNYQEAVDGQAMPFLSALTKQNVLLSNYFSVRHPSLPNYISLVSGSTQNISKDCIDCFVDQPNLADLIEASGRTWKTYQEDMPSPCFVGDAPPYFQKHNPFIYFDSIRLDPKRCQRSVLPLTQLDADLSSNQLPNFAFIMPNICNSGHDCPPGTADNWLNAMVTRLQASPALGKNSLIVVTFDEGGDKSTGTCCGMEGKGGGQVLTVLVSPLAQPGFKDSTAYSHYSLLKTILTAWNLADLGKTSQLGTQPIVAPWIGQEHTTTSGENAPPTPPDPVGDGNQAANCATGSPASGKYTLNLCLSQPLAGTALSGNVTVTAILNLSGISTNAPGNLAQRVVFYLDGAYLLSDFQEPYTFTLPSAKWANGKHSLAVEAQMRDTFVSPQASLTLNFNNEMLSTQTQDGATQFQPATGSTPVNNSPFIVAAAGDGASGEDKAVRVSDLIASVDPNLFLYLGDVYDRGSPAEFLNWYGNDTTGFGRFRSITNPTVGNHEYLTADAAGYFDYWNNIPDYYSFNANGWHFISLDSNGGKSRVGPDSAEYQWLANDLAQNSTACTIVYYHHPLFNIGPEGTTDELLDMWKLMAQDGVTAVLNGHDHTYQRWKPLDGNGQPDPAGITEFVVGTSGHGLQTIKNSDSRVAYSIDTNPTAFGVLLLQLNPDGVTFTYQSTDHSILDSGVIPCARHAPDTQAPETPGALSATATSITNVKLAWLASNDNTGTSSYAIYRDDSLLADVQAGSLGYIDETVQPNTSYTYTVEAIDPAGNHSAASSPAKVTTPEVPSNLVFPVAADTYVNASNPGFNYGEASILRADATPDLRSYLRFNVQGLGGKSVARATLKVYANSSASNGINVFTVVDNNWDENALNYEIAPSLGSLLGASGPIKNPGTWITLDVTAYVTGEGQFSFGITTAGSTAISIASRESGANAPQLFIDLK